MIFNISREYDVLLKVSILTIYKVLVVVVIVVVEVVVSIGVRSPDGPS